MVGSWKKERDRYNEAEGAQGIFLSSEKTAAHIRILHQSSSAPPPTRRAPFVRLKSLADNDGDRRYERLSLTDARGELVDAFTITIEGKLVPIPDAELHQFQDVQKRLQEAMKKFDR